MESSWHSYPKIYNLGHAALTELFLDPVLVEEKVDGSQFSFGRFGGELKCRSKGAQLYVDHPEKMFERAVEEVSKLELVDGWTYRGEYLQKPKHNSICYDRVPQQHVILFDVNPAEEVYLTYDEKAAEALRLGLDVVPQLHCGIVSTEEMFRRMLDTVSILGGSKIEGVVIKNYNRFGPDKKVIMGKHVSEAFKEVHAKSWKENNPANKDIIEVLIGRYRTPARWHKAVQHLRERGDIENNPRDIGKLLAEVKIDVQAECEHEMASALFKWAWPQIQRGIIAGLPEWYKDELIKRQFADRA